MRIKNKEILISHGDVEGRKVALDIVEQALSSTSSYERVKEFVSLSDNLLSVGTLNYDLNEIKNLFVFGAGKATLGQAKALDEILSNRIAKGIVIVKKGQGNKLNYIDVLEGGHPLPDIDSFLGAKKILSEVKNVGKGDLVFLLDSGGSSALMSHPAEDSEITFQDERKATCLLLDCGAPIYEINSVRRHITAMKGGRMQKLILSKGAEVINFVISDSPRIVQKSSNIIIPRQGGWEDETTFEDAVKVLKSYDLWVKTPSSIKDYLIKGIEGKIPETPKDFKGMKVHTFTLGNTTIACEAAKKRAKQLGFQGIILTTVLEGESKEAGITLASIAKEIKGNNRIIKPPCVLIFGGETTVTIKDGKGVGGPSQELALGFALKISGLKNITCLALDTDGTDGPTEYAGGIVDGFTLPRAKSIGLDIFMSLKRHDSTNAFTQLEDIIFTGPTDTNVCDLNIVVIR